MGASGPPSACQLVTFPAKARASINGEICLTGFEADTTGTTASSDSTRLRFRPVISLYKVTIAKEPQRIDVQIPLILSDRRIMATLNLGSDYNFMS